MARTRSPSLILSSAIARLLPGLIGARQIGGRLLLRNVALLRRNLRGADRDTESREEHDRVPHYALRSHATDAGTGNPQR